MTFSTLHAALKELYFRRTGVGDGKVPAFDNGVVLSFRNAAGTADIEFARAGADGSVQLAGGALPSPTYWPLVCRIGPNAEAVDHIFHVFNQPSSIAAGGAIGRVVKVEGWFNTQASTGTVTAQIKKGKSGKAMSTATSLTSDSFNLRSTNATRQQLTLSANSSTLEFTGGDYLSIDITGTPTSFAGGLFIVWVQYYTLMAEVSFRRVGVDTAGTDEQFFVANRSYPFWGATSIWTAAEATAARTLQVTNDTSTNAAGAGTDLLSTAIDLQGAPNIARAAAFTATTIATGNRLAVDYSGAPTELANLCVTLAFTPQPGRVEATYYRHDTNVVDEAFFMASRDFEVWDGRQIHGVAAGGASTAQLTKDTGTTAAGGGTDLLGTAWDLNATAQTVQGLAPITTSAAKAALLLNDGDRLAIDFANTEQSTVGVAKTISLIAR